MVAAQPVKWRTVFLAVALAASLGACETSPPATTVDAGGRSSRDEDPGKGSISDPPSSVTSTTGPATTTSGPSTTSTSRPATTTSTTRPLEDCESASAYAFGIALVAPGRGWVAGPGGLQQTVDGGMTWSGACLPPEVARLNSVTFLGSLLGWALGSADDGGLLALRTDDGGRKWKRAFVPADVGGDLGNASFLDASAGWAVGRAAVRPGGNPVLSGGIILTTVDGGGHWSSQTVPDGVGILNAVHFADRRHGWIAGATPAETGLILATGDGGASWTAQSLPDGVGQLKDVLFLDSDHGFAVGGNSTGSVILATEDGGWTWVERLSDAGGGALWGIARVADGTIFAGGLGNMWASVDEGGSWERRGRISPAWASDIAFADSEHGWIAYENSPAICVTGDGGRTWQRRSLQGGTSEPC